MIIAGDLFHSHANKELELFKRWREDLSLIDIHLVKGNHDVLVDEWYSKAGITVSDHIWTNAPFLFCHDNDDEQVFTVSRNHYTIAGHIHPGITLNGMGRQSLRFPCFYFTESYCVLPAFSHFTGTYRIIPKEGEDVFAIVNNKIIPIG
jgi:metallophosphoesterase superfamily enzyme